MSSKARSLARAIRTSPVFSSIIETPDDTEAFATAISTATGGAVGSGGSESVNTASDLPLSGNEVGDFAFVEETNRLYIWNGSGWYNIALINTSPSSITGADTTYPLNTDGTPTVITLNSADPEGLNLQWAYQVTSGSLTNGGGTTATISQNDNVFTITPTTTEDYAGEFSLTFTATDGVNIVSKVSSFTLQFAVSYPLLSSLTYSSSVNTTNVAGSSGFSLGYTTGFNISNDERWVSIGGEYGPAIWEFTTPGVLSTLTLRWSSAVPPNVNGNGGGGATLWNSDGSKIYYIYQQSGLKVLSWSWNGSSLSSGSQIKSVNLPSGWSSSRSVSGACFNGDGTSIFFVGNSVAVVYKYTLSTPYDLSTMSSSPAQTKLINWASDVVISPDDNYICWKEGISNTWKQYLFNSPLDLSNITQVASASFSNSGGNTSTIMPIGLRFKLDGSGVLIFDQQNDQIDEYLI